MSKIESVQIINKTKWKIIKENLLLNSFCFNNKLEKNWHKRLDVNDDDIIFNKYKSNNPFVSNIWSSSYENDTNADFTKNNRKIIYNVG